jgi:hypothetical protein
MLEIPLRLNLFTLTADKVGMKILILLTLTVYLTGCGTARLVRTRNEPIKSGTVKLEGQGPAGRAAAQDEAKRVMNRYCSPLQPKIVGTDEVSEIGGAYQSPFIRGAVNYDHQVSPLVHFECREPEQAPPRTPSSL